MFATHSQAMHIQQAKQIRVVINYNNAVSIPLPGSRGGSSADPTSAPMVRAAFPGRTLPSRPTYRSSSQEVAQTTGRDGS